MLHLHGGCQAAHGRGTRKRVLRMPRWFELRTRVVLGGAGEDFGRGGQENNLSEDAINARLKRYTRAACASKNTTASKARSGGRAEAYVSAGGGEVKLAIGQRGAVYTRYINTRTRCPYKRPSWRCGALAHQRNHSAVEHLATIQRLGG